MNKTKFFEMIEHAFKINDGSTDIQDRDLQLIDKLAQFIVKKRLTAPVSFFLESVRPLNFVGSSLMTFFRPTLGFLFNAQEYERLEKLLEKRCSIDLIIEKIDQVSNGKKV